jgi:hypothetical protein
MDLLNHSVEHDCVILLPHIVMKRRILNAGDDGAERGSLRHAQ